MNMQPEPRDREPDSLDRLLAEARWPEPRPEAIGRLRDQWQSLMANAQPINALANRRKMMRRALIFAAAATVLVCVWLGVSRFASDGPDATAFAQALEQIEKAKGVTWKWTVYEHVMSKDEKKTWVRTETQQKAYKAPGLYRETFLDEKGQVREVQITDAMHKKQLNMFPRTKEATLSEIVTDWGSSGPFDWVEKELEDNNLQWVGTRMTASGEVNIFRHAFRNQANGKDWSYDFWIDQKTKRLVEVHTPGADIYNPDKDPAQQPRPKRNGPERQHRVLLIMTLFSTQAWTTRNSGLQRPRATPSKPNVAVR